MSSRWSYGPEGLRERPAVRWSDAELLPRWRDLQPLLIRSAGVVGIVATIMAVVSSDALRFGGEIPRGGRNDQSAGLAPAGTPVIAAASELNAGKPAEPAAAAATETVAVEAAAVQVAAIEPPAPPIDPVVADFGTESAEAPVASIPTPVSAVPTPLVQVAAIEPPAPPIEPGVANSAMESPENPAATTSTTVAVPTPAREAITVEAPAPPEPPTVADLRKGPAPGPVLSAAAPLTTASVPAHETAERAGPALATLAAAEDAPPAEMSLTAFRPSDAPLAQPDANAFAWPDGAETCPRDWVAGGHDGHSLDCTATDALIDLVAVDQSALEQAVSEHAQELAALMPRIPVARPEPPADFKPTNPHTRRVSRSSSSWPDEPPPNCAAGQRAKWRFVDRQAGKKAWYCK